MELLNIHLRVAGAVISGGDLFVFMTQQIQLTEEEKTILKFNADKLLVLLSASDLSNEVKDSLIAMVPEMTFEQIDELIASFELAYLDQQTSNIDEEYIKKLNDLN